jgi:monoterpene epsilon-lactone hydrolase
VSRSEAEAIEKLLREGPLDLGGSLAEQRPLLDALMTSHPLPAGTVTTSEDLGGVPVVNVITPSSDEHDVVLYFHGGAFALGSAFAAAGMLADLAGRAGVRGVSVEYRLAPEDPYPAGLEDGVSAYRGLLDNGVAANKIVIAGESAGAGLVLSLLLSLRDHGLPYPAAAVVFSPWADLTLTNASLISKAGQDPALTLAALRTRGADYRDGHDPADPFVSPARGDYAGLPPLLIQVGTHEILLDDAIAVAGRAAAGDVAVTLEVTPNVPHVFQGFAAALEEGDAALRSAADFIRTHLS